MRILLALALVALASIGCDSRDANGVPTPAQPAQQTAQSPGTAGAAAPEAATAPGAVAQAGGATYADTRYPTLLFGLLDEAERARFVGLAEAELCPCGTVESLDACLQRAEVCEMGVQAGALMMRMVKEGAGDVEITDEVQRFVANARRVWEFELADTPWVGAAEPRIVLVNFSDFECPHCREFAEVLHQVVERYGDTVRVYYKQFPLGSHPNAAAAAVAALAAHRQGQFGPYHDLVFERQSALSAATDPASFLVGIATEVGLNGERFVADANDAALRAQVDRDRREGMEAGLMSTPTCFFDGVKMMDGYTLEELTARIDARLAAP